MFYDYEDKVLQIHAELEVRTPLSKNNFAHVLYIRHPRYPNPVTRITENGSFSPLVIINYDPRCVIVGRKAIYKNNHFVEIEKPFRISYSSPRLYKALVEYIKLS